MPCYIAPMLSSAGFRRALAGAPLVFLLTGCPKKAPAPTAASPGDKVALTTYYSNDPHSAGATTKYAPRVEVAVTGGGFVPARIPARAGQPLTLVITRKTDQTCAREIVFQGQDGKTELPLDKPVEVTYTPKASGEVKFGCGMGMMVGGVLAVGD
jgi:hypothetical protein